jgi:hypothetical protein
MSAIRFLSSEQTQQPHTHQPNYLDKWTFRVELATFFVLLFTLLGVWDYACQARDQTLIAADNLENSSRPILSVGRYFPSIPTGEGQQPTAIGIVSINNSGHLPTKAYITTGSTFSSRRLVSGPPLSDDGEFYIVPPGEWANRIDYPGAPTTAANEHGGFYLSGLMQYSTKAGSKLRHYETRFCYEFPWPNNQPFDKGRLCQDKKTNDIN